MVFTSPAELAALPAGYRQLFGQAAATFEADARVRAMWLHGALARGAADAGSDLDVTIAVAEERFAAFAVFFRDAPAIAERNTIPWPVELERAVRAYLEREGAPLPAAAPPAAPDAENRG